MPDNKPWRVCPDCGWSYETEGDTHQRFNCRRAFRPQLKHIPDPRFHPKPKPTATTRKRRDKKRRKAK